MKITYTQAYNYFIQYIEEWRALENEYYRIPNWRFIKKMHNIKSRETLTRVFVARMKHYGVIEK